MRLFALGLGLVVFLLDLLTKRWVQNTEWLHDFKVVDGFVTIQLVRNEGIAFGLLHSLESDWKPILLSLIALVAVGIVLYYIASLPRSETLAFLSLGLLLGGVLGNFADRLIHGYVIDFLTLHWRDFFYWPTFNIADAAISTGVILILLETLFPTFVRRTAVGAFLLAALAGSAAAMGDLTKETVSRLQVEYDRIESFQADFEQIYEDRGVTLRETGKVLMQKPGRMYWEYREPKEKHFVADGEKTFFYVPQDRQVFISHLNLEEADSPLLFLLGKGDLEAEFEVSLFEGQRLIDSENLLLELTPRQPHPEFVKLVLEVDPDSFMIQRLSVHEPLGPRNDYILRNIQRNVKIPDRAFRLSYPSDVEIIR